MVVSLIIVGGLVLLLLPQLLNLIKSLQNNSNTAQQESELAKTIDSVIGPQLVQDSTTLETPGQIAVNNLKSNITLTPLPNDPLFGVDGFFTKIGDVLFNPDSSKTKEVVG